MFDYSLWQKRCESRIKEPNLPKTVTRLVTDQGSQVYLIGTAHFSRASEEDVKTVIKQIQPDIVVVELCSSRSSIMQLDETTLLHEAKNVSFSSLQNSIKQYGALQGIVHILLLSISAQITKQLGMAPGGEFRAAFNETIQIPGSKLVMGDRPINITLKRAISSLSFWNKIKFMWCLLFNNETISQEDVEKYKEKDMLEEFLESMAGEYPELRRVFVDERDSYLAHVLKQAAQPVMIKNPSPPYELTLIPQVVVGVVGMGHTIGISKKWNETIDLAPLLELPGENKYRKTFKGIAFTSCVIVISYGGYKLVKSFF